MMTNMTKYMPPPQTKVSISGDILLILCQVFQVNLPYIAWCISITFHKVMVRKIAEKLRFVSSKPLPISHSHDSARFGILDTPAMSEMSY
jgi:hypothetical protein